MNKKGIELAASLIVVLIVSIIIFGLAGGLTYKILCASSEKVSEIDQQTEKLVDQKLNSGARVQLGTNSKSAKSRASFCGGESNGAAYALGVRNDELSQEDYTINCAYKGVEKDGVYQPPQSTSCNGLVEYDRGVITLDAKEKVSKLVLVTGPNELGKHVFTISVCNTGGTICNPQDTTAQNGFYGAATIYYIVK